MTALLCKPATKQRNSVIMETVFVTTGATVTFQKLIEMSLDSKFIDCLQTQGYQRLILQYGSQDDGVTLFKHGLTKLNAAINTNPNGVIGILENGFIVEGFPFTNDIESVMLLAELIISHAGTGSILDSLRLNKPLIVVINQKLMNNHQAEITNELERDNYLIGCSSNLHDLISKAKLARNVRFNSLPKPNTTIIDEIIQQL